MTGAGGVAVLMGRCNPYGHETGGPRHLAGGVYGPEHEGRIKWNCENSAEVRVRMICGVGHKGQIMKLCRPHAREIQKRQSDTCPRCAWPPEALALDLEIRVLQGELAQAMSRMHGQTMGGFLMIESSPDYAKVAKIQTAIEAKGFRMTELYQAGIIRKVGLRLEEVA